MPNSIELYAWQSVGTVNAVHFLDAYSFIAPTTSDSVGGSNPRTIFMVVARNASGSMYWLSAPDSGYSVDNIAPATPAPFAGEYAAGTTTLHWNPNVEADFAHYALYRGTPSTFTPGPANLVASPADTGYVDAGGQPYFYKLAAIDVHGNTSGYASLRPSGTVSVLPGGVSGRIALALPSPNPMRAGATFRFELSRAGPATLALFDQQGRLVRELARGASSAGPRTVAWDGRDAGGATAPSGIYFLRLEAEGQTLMRRVVVTR